MIDSQDVRWRQRFSSFKKALRQLGEAVELRRQRSLTNLEKQGVIQAFEYTYELGWNTLKDYLAYQGIVDVVGARDTIRQAFRRELIKDSEGWMEMLADRNLTAHTYNESTADEIVRKVCDRHYGTLAELREKMAANEVVP
jgi:nucleotidyltransferase substrate binding protein (TIGR01987 family)